MNYFVRDGDRIVGPLDPGSMRRYIAQCDPAACAYRAENSEVWVSALALPSVLGSPALADGAPSHNVSVAGGLLVGFCFFLPWVETGCGTLSGADLARVDGGFWVALVAAAVAIGAAMMRSDLRETNVRAVVGGSAAFVLLFLGSKAMNVGGSQVDRLVSSLRVGAYGTALGLWMIILSVFVAQPTRAPRPWETPP